MYRISRSLVLLLLALPAVSGECISNLTVLSEVVFSSPVFDLVEYTLCPNTVYQVGDVVGGQCCRDGDSPLILRSNTIIQCGEDGSRANNCTFLGGQSHVTMAFEIFEEVVTGTEVRGMTFGDASVANVLLLGPGNVSFVDCSFSTRNARVAPVEVGWMPPDSLLRRRLRAVHDELDSARRNLQVNTEDLLTPLHATFERCIFEGNSKVEKTVTPRNAPLAIKGPLNHATVKDCIFRNNEFNVASSVRTLPIAHHRQCMHLTPCTQNSGSCIEVDAGSLTLEGTSFVNNTLKNFGIVDVVNNGTVVIGEGNTFDEATIANVQCEVAIRDDPTVAVAECLSFSTTDASGVRLPALWTTLLVCSTAFFFG